MHTVDASVPPPPDECRVSMDTAAYSSASFDEGKQHSFDFGHRQLLTSVTKSSLSRTPTSIESDRPPSHAIKPLKKRRLAEYRIDASGEKEEPAKSSMSASAHSIGRTHCLPTALASVNFGGHGIAEGDAVELRPDIVTHRDEQIRGKPNISKAHQSATVNTSQVHRIGEGRRLPGVSAGSSGDGSSPLRVGLSPKYDEKLKNSTTHAKPSKSSSPLPSHLQIPTRGMHLKMSDRKWPEVRLKLKLKQKSKPNESESVPTGNSRGLQSQAVQFSQTMPKAKKSYSAQKEEVAWRPSPRTKHDVSVREAGTTSEVTPNSEQNPPMKFWNSGVSTPGHRDEKVRRNRYSESENKEPNPLVVKVNAAALLPSRNMSVSVRESTKNALMEPFGKQKKVTEARRMGSTTTKRTGQKSEDVGSGQGFRKGVELKISSPRGAAAGSSSINDNSRNSSSSVGRSVNKARESKVQRRVGADTEKMGYEAEFSLDDLTYYPAQSGNDEDEYEEEQHDSVDDGVRDTADVHSHGHDGDTDENKGLLTCDSDVHDGSGTEDEETERKSKVSPDSARDVTARRRRRIKRKRLGKLFVSEEDEDEEDPEFVPSKKLRYAVRRMRAQQEEQEHPVGPSRQRRSNGGGSGGDEIVEGDNVRI